MAKENKKKKSDINKVLPTSKRYKNIDFSKEENILTPLETFKAKCIDCMGGQPGLVRSCDIVTCAVYPWRNGTPECKKRKVSDEQKKKMAARLAKARAKKK